LNLSEHVIRALYRAFARRDVDAAMALCDPGLEFWAQGTGRRAARTAPYRGYEGLREYFADVDEAWDELVVEPEDFRFSEDGVIVFGTVRGRSGTETLEAPVIWVWKMRRGRVSFGRAVSTSAEAAQVMRGSAVDG
jgi:ketosteroid isomerase-like protein